MLRNRRWKRKWSVVQHDCSLPETMFWIAHTTLTCAPSIICNIAAYSLLTSCIFYLLTWILLYAHVPVVALSRAAGSSGGRSETEGVGGGGGRGRNNGRRGRGEVRWWGQLYLYCCSLPSCLAAHFRIMATFLYSSWQTGLPREARGPWAERSKSCVFGGTRMCANSALLIWCVCLCGSSPERPSSHSQKPSHRMEQFPSALRTHKETEMSDRLYQCRNVVM